MTYSVLKRRCRLLGVLLTVAVTSAVLMFSRWSRLTDQQALTGSSDAAVTERLQFYGAAAPRNLFSSELVSPAAAAVPVAAARRPSTTTTTKSPAAGVTELPEPGQPRLRTFDRYDKELDLVAEGEQPPLTEEWLQRQAGVYQRRLATLRRVCAQRRVGLNDTRAVRSIISQSSRGAATETAGGGDDPPVETVAPSHFTVVPPQRTMTCLINKAASTSLLSTFLKLTGHGVPMFDELASPHSIAIVLQPTRLGLMELAKKQFFKFLLVRHPLERLVSAYEDKVVKADHPSLLRLRSSILSVHEDMHIRRAVYQQLRESTANQTEVLAAYDARLTAYRAEVAARAGVPTFSEFLDFVLDRDPTGEGFDSHWTPYWRQCAPCHIDYEVIAKLETADDDLKYIWNRMGIYASVKIPRQNQRSATAQGALAATIRRYLTPVPAATVRRLRELFQLDFQLFDYDWKQMLRLSGHCGDTEPCELD